MTTRQAELIDGGDLVRAGIGERDSHIHGVPVHPRDVDLYVDGARWSSVQRIEAKPQWEHIATLGSEETTRMLAGVTGIISSHARLKTEGDLIRIADRVLMLINRLVEVELKHNDPETGVLLRTMRLVNVEFDEPYVQGRLTPKGRLTVWAYFKAEHYQFDEHGPGADT